MGKKKDAKKAAKAAGGDIKLPKAIGGVKVPKELRQSGEALLAKANSPAGRQMIASGLTIAAGAAAAAIARRQAPPPAPAPSPAATTPTTPAVDPQQIADAVGAAADAVLARLFAAKRPG